MNDLLTIVSEEENVRLDRYLAENTDLSRTRCARLIEDGRVLINGKAEDKRHKLSCGDTIEVFLPENSELAAEAENIPLDIIYEDSDIIVINKPQGMVVHPAPGNYSGTLVNALLYHCRDSLSGINGVLRPGIVHRIDKDTSGLLVVAKNDEAHSVLAAMFKAHDFTRRYHTIVYGNLAEDCGTIQFAVGRSKNDRKKMAAFPPDTPNTKNAITNFKVLERLGSYTYLECTLETGRTHQIRVHMQKIGHPVLDDPLYATGRKTFGLCGQCLHAKVLAFSHPRTGENLYFEAPLPPYFTEVLEKLRKENF